MHNIRELQLMLMNCSRARYRAFRNNVKEPFHFRTAYNLAPEWKMNCACRGEKIVNGGKFVWDMHVCAGIVWIIGASTTQEEVNCGLFEFHSSNLGVVRRIFKFRFDY